MTCVFQASDDAGPIEARSFIKAMNRIWRINRRMDESIRDFDLRRFPKFAMIGKMVDTQYF